MSTSSNKQQKKGKDGMGEAGKRKEMVKDWGGVSCAWKSKLCVRCVCVCACRSCVREGRKNKGGGEKDREVKQLCG